MLDPSPLAPVSFRHVNTPSPSLAFGAPRPRRLARLCLGLAVWRAFLGAALCQQYHVQNGTSKTVCPTAKSPRSSKPPTAIFGSAHPRAWPASTATASRRSRPTPSPRHAIGASPGCWPITRRPLDLHPGWRCGLPQKRGIPGRAFAAHRRPRPKAESRPRQLAVGTAHAFDRRPQRAAGRRRPRNPQSPRRRAPSTPSGGTSPTPCSCA